MPFPPLSPGVVSCRYIAAALAVALASSQTPAATITVTTAAGGSSSSDCTIVDAVDAANRDSAVGGCVSGDEGQVDTIVFADTLANVAITPGTTLILDDGELTIDGGRQRITLSGANQYKLIESDRGSSLRRLQGLALVNGASQNDGGAIDNDGMLEVIGCTVRNNRADDDGGGINNKGTLKIESSTVEDNTAGDDGGGISNKGALTIDRSSVNLNAATDDAGAISNSGELTIWNSVLTKNFATDDAGAIDNEGIALIHNTTLSLNSTDNDSGAIDNSGEMTLEQSMVSKNQTSDDGGAIYNTGTLTIVGSTVVDNEAGDDGGSIYNAGSDTPGSLAIQNSTLSLNFAADEGGAVYNDGDETPATLSIVNSTLTRNYAIDAGATIGGAGNLRLVNSVIADSQVSPACSSNTVLAANISNWFEDSSCDGVARGDPQLGPLADNGGPTLTQLPQGFDALIDAGDNAHCLTIDQRGVARPQDRTCDIGAVEVVTTPFANCADGTLEFETCLPARGGWRSTLGR
jgi:predicted outer membrane repeat protein